MRKATITLALAAAILIAGCSTKPLNAADCDKIKDKTKQEQCVYNISLTTYNSGACAKIMTKELKNKCIDDIALAMKDYLPCKSHEKMPLRDKCEAKVSEVRKAVRDNAKEGNTTA